MQPATSRAPGRLILVFLLSLYLLTAGGKGYSVDGAFGYEMAKTVFLDPEHAYFGRFKTAFARWGGLMPLLGQPFVLAGDALSRVAPERDALSVGGHNFRIEEWPALGAGGRPAYAPPLPAAFPPPVVAIGLVSFLANASAVPQGTIVGQVRVWEGDSLVELPVRAGVETAEWAHDRPDLAGLVQHARPQVAGHWIGQPRGKVYYTRLYLPRPMTVDRWELAGLHERAAWHIRAAAFQVAEATRPKDSGASGTWIDVHTGERYWSPRQTRDFFTRLIYSAVNAFTTALAAVLVYAIAGQFGYRPATSALAAMGYGVATMAWPYAKLDFSEPASTVFALLAVWALYQAFPPAQAAGSPADRLPSSGLGQEKEAPPRDEVRREKLPAAGRLGLIAAGGLLLAVAGKYTAVLMAAGITGQWVLSSRWWDRDLGRRRAALRFLAALVVPAAALGLAAATVMYAFTGEVPIVLASGAGRLFEDWLALPIWIGLRGLLFSPGKSAFLYSPWLLLAVPGAVLFAWRHRRHGALIFAYPLLVVLLYSMKLVWHGGAWGPRYLLPLVPLLCVAAAPAIDWCLARGRRRRLALAALAVVSAGVQLLAVSKDPEQYPSMVREFVVPALPDFGSRLGGRDYWLARGGDGLARALQDPSPAASPVSRRRGLGYLWGEPDAELRLHFRETRTFNLSLYFVDWERQVRRQTVTLEDALGTRTLELDGDFGNGVWATWQVTASGGAPVLVRLYQRGRDTAVVSAVTFDPVAPASTERRNSPRIDHSTRGDWPGAYGADGYVLFAWRSFNLDVPALPSYVARYDVSHSGDKPEPRIHVEIAEQDLLDTPLLYALPFSPLLGNVWLLAGDAAHLLLPSQPGLVSGILSRPPWTWFGVSAPLPSHPEHGLGLDFWPTLLYTNYASHQHLLVVMWSALGLLELTLVVSATALVRVMAPASRRRAWSVAAGLGLSLLFYNWLQVRA